MKDKFGDKEILFWGIQKGRLNQIRNRKIIYIGREMKYQCGNCGEVRYMLLEVGLEEPRLEGRKPVPFTITCPKCLELMRHVDWHEDRILPLAEHVLGKDIGNDLFVDISGSDCGLPIYSETLDGLIPSDAEIHAISESNRAQRRARKKHPSWDVTRYKRADY